MPKLGRPPGAKNKLTLLKESEKKKALALCEGHIFQYAPKIVVAMCKKALEGDVKAAALIMNRVYPEMRQVDKQLQGINGITININKEQPSDGKEDGSRQGQAIDGRADPANGSQSFHSAGVTIIAEHAGEEGERSD